MSDKRKELDCPGCGATLKLTATGVSPDHTRADDHGQHCHASGLKLGEPYAKVRSTRTPVEDVSDATLYQ